jgi:ABC-type Fe3+ transport system permease subunit
MLATYSAMHFVYVQWLRKRTKTANGVDGVFAFSLVILMNTLSVLGLVSPAIFDFIMSQSKLVVCASGIVISIAIVVLNQYCLGDRTKYINNVKYMLNKKSQKKLLKMTLLWLFGSIFLFFYILFLIADS